VAGLPAPVAVAGRHCARSWRAPPYLDAWLACLCSALLPPCPEPTSDVRVPLAGLHIGSNPCRVLRVCNWTTQRKFATTFPALQYWLSVSPIMREFRQLLDLACCFDLAGLLPQDRLASGVADGPPEISGLNTHRLSNPVGCTRERSALAPPVPPSWRVACS
jgi:hypothetical protein